MWYKRTVYANAIAILTFSTVWLNLLCRYTHSPHISPVPTDINGTAEEVASTVKTFYSCSKEFETLALASWIYTAGYILQVLITRKSYIWALWNVLLKYNYAHLVTNCWFCCWNFSTFDAFPRSLGKPIYWNLNFEIYFQFVSAFFIKNFQK